MAIQIIGMQPTEQKTLDRREQGSNVWLEKSGLHLSTAPVEDYFFNVLDSEEAVGQAMFDELKRYVKSTDGDIVIVPLGDGMWVGVKREG